ncbi:MAG: arylsulfatase [Bacteroidia bacterium]|nr:arylsulfatase [Bacteroidia bacterium]
MTKLSLLFTGITICLYLSTGSSCKPISPREKGPNIIFILADDLGYGDLSCYGQQKFQTPHLDKLAAEGMLFTQHYAGTTVCAPSRSALMTGFHTGHTFIRGNKEVQPEGQHPLPDSAFTLAEMLKTRGYVTGAFGKWGLGFPGSEGDPNRQGFDEFLGYNCQRLAHSYYPRHLWHNQKKVELPQNAGTGKNLYAPDYIHRKTLDFIEKNKDTTFFLFVPNVIPHAELVTPDSLMSKFRGKFLPEKPFEGTDEGENYRNGPYASQAEPHAAFAAMIYLLDKQVGEIMAKLKETGIDDNTLVIFSSDNGPHLEAGADPDYFDSNGPLKGYKRDLYEGGIRVPMIARWPGKILPGTTADHVSAFWDLMPTLADLTNATIPDYYTDGISYLPTLLRQGKQRQHRYLYWEFHEKSGRVAIRKGNWKAIKYDYLNQPEAPFELYDLKQDEGETQNLAANFPEVLAEMEKILKKARTDSEIFNFGAR